MQTSITEPKKTINYATVTTTFDTAMWTYLLLKDEIIAALDEHDLHVMETMIKTNDELKNAFNVSFCFN
jgi:hypothetical protein